MATSKKTGPGILQEAGALARSWMERLRNAMAARPRLMAGLVTGLITLIALGGGVAVGTWNAVCRDCPSVAAIYVWEPKSATKILDRDRRLIAELFQERRTPVRLETLPSFVPQAFIAVEDKRFYRHNGFDAIRLISANLDNVLSGRITGGGSTITQQLARWMFQDEIGFEQVIRRKLKEMKVAIELERIYTKQEILEAYINQVNYGDGRHGIEAASQYFFGKPAVELNPSEAALLAGVINRPTTYSPFRNPEASRRRRNIVLRLMNNQGFLTDAELRQWQAEPLPESPHRGDEGRVAPYFVEWVRGQLDNRFGSDLYSRGFQVVTTLDLDMQHAAQTAMEAGWNAIEASPGFRAPKYADLQAEGGVSNTTEMPYLQGMFIAMDPASGEVRALIGGRDFEESKFNRATQALRQAGSTFKPFTYAAAVASGIPASHVIFDSPVMLEQMDGSVYSPKNYDPDFRGPLTLRDALKFSVNTVAVKLGVEVGLETVAQTARQMGIRTEVPPYHSTPIGAPSVYPLQLTEAYTAFATGGMRAGARSILLVEDQQGRVLWESRPEREEVLDPMVAAIVRDLLRTALDNGTGYSARNPSVGNLPYDVPAGGKTGTTNDATDIWFVGFTPDLVASVWFGFDRPRPITRNAAGGVFAAPVWGRFMRQVYYGRPATETSDSVPAVLPIPENWEWPEGMTSRLIDRVSGRLATTWCGDSTALEHFIPGTEPTETCSPSGNRGLFGGGIRRYDADDTLDAGGSSGRRGVFGAFPRRAPLDTVRLDTTRSGIRPARIPPDTTSDTTAGPFVRR
jgi:penicillin-binding protein 1A